MVAKNNQKPWPSHLKHSHTQSIDIYYSEDIQTVATTTTYATAYCCMKMRYCRSTYLYHFSHVTHIRKNKTIMDSPIMPRPLARII